jgi:DNA-binding transcriptional ArsR family regulator
MDDSTSSPAKPSGTHLPLAKVLPVISSIPRWHILRELAKGEPLPVHEIARRMRFSPTSISKHLAILFDSGVVRRGYGCLYSIEPAFLVPGERAMDFGNVLIRFDRMA